MLKEICIRNNIGVSVAHFGFMSLQSLYAGFWVNGTFGLFWNAVDC